MSKVTASNAYFIKLGEGGEWEAECLRDGTIKFGYRRTPHELCLAADWDKVREVWKEIRKDGGAATRDANQIRAFYEADENTIFITFVNGSMYWCRPSGPVKVMPAAERIRRTVDGWHGTNIRGVPLTSDKLSGNLLKVQMFRGTICRVKPFDYLMRKLNDQPSPELDAANRAEQALVQATVELLRLLTWQDFELLIDLIFSSSGWRRIGVVGRVQKTVDLELLLPTTGERAFVQVKGQADAASLREYIGRFKQADEYDRMFFVWHSGRVDNVPNSGVTTIGPDRVSQMVLDAGLFSWLREKVS